MRTARGFTLIELMVSSAVTFITVLAVSAAFVGYSRSFYAQAGIRGGQASLRQTHLMVVRNLRMAGYGVEPPLAFGFPDKWSREDSSSINRSDRLVFRMRDQSFNAFVSTADVTNIKLDKPLTSLLRAGQILQIVCPGAVKWTYAQLSTDATVGSSTLPLVTPNGKFPRLNDFTPVCFGTTGGASRAAVFKIEVFDYSIQLIDDDYNPATPDRPYLFRRHGLGETDPDSYGEPVAEDIEALRVTFIREDGTAFTPNPTDTPPDYSTPLGDALRLNNNPANIRAVVIGLVARSTTRDASALPGTMGQIPSFGRKADGTPEPAISVDGSGKALPAGFRRIVSEMSVQVRNIRSAEMPMPIYTLDSSTPNACKGAYPSDNFNCAGG